MSEVILSFRYHFDDSNSRFACGTFLIQIRSKYKCTYLNNVCEKIHKLPYK